MDLQTSLICAGVVVISAAVILIVSIFGMKVKSYEEALAEQRKLPDDLLLAGKKDRVKEKKHKNKTGKKVKEKKEDNKEEKEEKQDEKPEHVQFEETPQILPPDTPPQEACKISKKKNKGEKVKPILVNKDESPIVVADSAAAATQIPVCEVNHFEIIHPKDDLELIRSQSKDNLIQSPAVEPPVNKSPKDTPTKLSKKAQKPVQKKDLNVVDAPAPAAPAAVAPAVAPTQNVAPASAPAPAPATAPVQQAQPVAKESSKKSKKKTDFLAQITNEKDGVDITVMTQLIANAQWSRSEIQILVEQLLNKQQDNPVEHSEWSEGRSDPILKLKKQLAEKEKALAEEQEANQTYQNKIKELRAEFNLDRSKLQQQLKEMKEDLDNKITEAQTLQTRKQHILETHTAEKQRLLTQIEQLQAKVNEDAGIIHKMQTEQGQAQSQLQKELNAQRQQLESQFVQMRETEKALQAQLAQKHHEVQELQSVQMTMTQELQATCESSAAEIDMLRQQLVILQEQYMHAEGQLQHCKDAGDRLQDMARQLEESHRIQADLDHRLKNSMRHEQDLQKQIHSLQNDLKVAKTESSELTKVQNELVKLKNDLSHSQKEAKNEAAEITTLKNLLATKDEELTKAQNDTKNAQNEIKKLEGVVADLKAELANFKADLQKSQEKEKNEVKSLQEKLLQAEEFVKNSKEATGKLKAELETFQNGDKKSTEVHLQMTKLQEENNRLVGRIEELQKEAKVLKERVNKENGVNEANNVDAGLLKQKDAQIEGLRAELGKKGEEFERLKEQVEGLKNDVKSQTGARKKLEEDLEAQKAKNNELRTKNWKVMEALSAAESRCKNSGKTSDESSEKLRLAEQESTKSLLQRIIPDVKIQEESYDKWLTSFEKHVNVILSVKTKNDPQPELEKEIKNLQSMVLQYKKIIGDTEGMLNNLQSHVESEESRWQSELRLKEGELANLRLELKELTKKSTANDALQQRILSLESRLAEKETNTQKIGGSLAELEQLQEEKQRLVEELEKERSSRINVDTELNQLRSLIDKHEAEVARLMSLSRDVSSTPDQSSVNGPPSDSSKTEGGDNSDNSKIESKITPTTATVQQQPQQQHAESDNSSLNSELNPNSSTNGQQKKKNKKKKKAGSGKK